MKGGRVGSKRGWNEDTEKSELASASKVQPPAVVTGKLSPVALMQEKDKLRKYCEQLLFPYKGTKSITSRIQHSFKEMTPEQCSELTCDLTPDDVLRQLMDSISTFKKLQLAVDTVRASGLADLNSSLVEAAADISNKNMQALIRKLVSNNVHRL